ncbi:PspA/IM30 family protein [Aphanothece sacrum]|uniref:Phage shock protein A n=1 Tax=Aphanothece sacrum FPU1 TaxID=1920663 RepID=A0A401IM91_APHSA|nr:PspA/IM30 family protein [Aphanothece sacrum]GBF82353.1 phage shock protein A [Aphanothece sacrum FPU1]GBF84253.1 phage shock protein A [Aphanothece sacrum FPU3]
MEWLERISRVVRAQINYLVQENQDPEKILEDAISLMEQELITMRRALAEAIATYKQGQRQVSLNERAGQKWYERAQLALDKGNEPLAREALVNRQSYQIQAHEITTQLEQQRQIIDKVKQDLYELERKYNQTKTKKNIYLARLRSATASQKMQEVMSNLNTTGSNNIFEQIEARILELEAHSELMNGMSSDPLEKQFTALEGNHTVDNELANLKAKKLKPKQ